MGCFSSAASAMAYLSRLTLDSALIKQMDYCLIKLGSE